MMGWELLVDQDGLVEVVIDHPLGSADAEHPDVLYELNDGLVRVRGLAKESHREWSAYVVGVYDPVMAFRGEVVAVIHRKDSADDKLVVAPEGMRFSKQQIKEMTYFQERFFDSEIELI